MNVEFKRKKKVQQISAPPTSPARNVITFIPDFPDARPFRSHAPCVVHAPAAAGPPLPTRKRPTPPHSKRHAPVALPTVAHARSLGFFLFLFPFLFCTLAYAALDAP